MKRDMDLIRELLLYIEGAQPARNGWINVSIPGRTNVEISCHLKMLAAEGLIDGRPFRTSSGEFWQLNGLTYAGHDFLDAARSDTLWKKATSVFLEAGRAAAITTIKDILLRLRES
jgi:hypothetical protein